MYPEHLVAPMRADIVEGGFKELKSAGEVDSVMTEKGTTLVFINSVCGCSARTARPGVKEAVWNAAKKPDHLYTVFAGVDQDATAKVREYSLPYAPSSPSIALFKDGDLVHFVERHHIEGRSAEMIAAHLEMVFEEFC
ncbi:MULTISPECIES: BrxA/BrxB family bacilliredoxin [Bacteroidota]|jgi:putative YphP/YqiW family bacilliredoxin|uniref:BrxA/BrxB family bacilliredoxin n=2 Tax=Flectobacillus TaxID=101 RepID=A0ABT6YXN5_9BACT|nr:MULTISPECIES: BrxA/BrxB family bacilliredoxin [Bacteroidota]MDI9867467.1 BrxA/BrxB family bacilliredoxin [Flectobacillus longus]MDI9873457.1 BrxA/BrxB family bacilliredoxin [Flectobacillus rivi]MDI9878732.1 BrxA/BrxB family bacilliredoxin [Flectobacillus longus]NBB29612.1 BrxA/BrxB family bacilliredoxin [Cellulophaga sp. BC115SP]